MKLSRIEQETIIVFNEAEAEARVNTFNRGFIKKLSAITEKNDRKIDFRECGDGEIECYIPKQWVRITPARKQSEKARAAALKGLEIARKARKAAKE